ncbi:MAG: ribosome assembly cofactor RimP [Marinilabiliales bacterium]|nr:ribosome assembly cofactor RimP [Marinilabiliales bacterium]
MISKEVIQRLAEEKLADTMFIVEISVSPANAITVTIDSDTGVNIDHCIEMSRFIEHQLDREVEDFSLEVSSPGLTQPFRVLRQYLKNLEKEVEVVTSKGEKLQGVLKSADDSGFTLEISKTTKIDGKKTTEVSVVGFRMDEIKTVKPVITFK